MTGALNYWIWKCDNHEKNGWFFAFWEGGVAGESLIIINVG